MWVKRLSIVIMLGLSIVMYAGCGKKTKSGDGSPATDNAFSAGQNFSSHPPQAEIQKYLLEWIKEKNPQISKEEAAKQMNAEFDAYMKAVMTDCIWSELLAPNQRIDAPPAHMDDIRRFADPQQLGELRKMRQEYELGFPWINDLLAAREKKTLMTQNRLDMIPILCLAEAGRLMKKLL